MSPITCFFWGPTKRPSKGWGRWVEVVIKLLKLVETHVLVIIMELGIKIMDPEINWSRLNMKLRLSLKRKVL